MKEKLWQAIKKAVDNSEIEFIGWKPSENGKTITIDIKDNADK